MFQRARKIWTLTRFKLTYNFIMKKLPLLLLLFFGLTSMSYGGYLDKWTDNQLCGWMNKPPLPTHIVAEVNIRGLYCESGFAIKTVKITITKESLLESRYQRWKNSLQRWNNMIKVKPFSSEKSIKVTRQF